MDRCSRCSSVHLVKRLGEVECRDCGAIVPPEASGEPGGPAADGSAGAGPGRPGPVHAGLAGAAGEDAGRRVRAAVLTCPRKWPGPWTGCWAGAWSARASSGRRIRPDRPVSVVARAGRVLVLASGRGGLVLGRSATARPGQVRPGRVPAAWMRSGLVRLLGERAGCRAVSWPGCRGGGRPGRERRRDRGPGAPRVSPPRDRAVRAPPGRRSRGQRGRDLPGRPGRS